MHGRSAAQPTSVAPRTGRHLRVDSTHNEPVLFRLAGDQRSSVFVAGIAVLALTVVVFLAMRPTAADGVAGAGTDDAEDAPVADGGPSARPAAPVAAPTTAAPAPLLGWVAVIEVVDRDGGRDALEAALAPLRGVVPSARVIESDGYPSLPPGEWAIVDGPFASGAAAAEYCMLIGAVVGDGCEGRVLSSSQSDRQRSCRLDGDALVGSCDG